MIFVGFVLKIIDYRSKNLTFLNSYSENMKIRDVIIHGV
jgi:hypothetical protein